MPLKYLKKIQYNLFVKFLYFFLIFSRRNFYSAVDKTLNAIRELLKEFINVTKVIKFEEIQRFDISCK